ncbi:MAG TPA: SRPBCC domain-containing protein [Tepidisphaeraceae bacterium]
MVRKTIRATAQHLFEAWTRPDHLKKWWGPVNVTCIEAMVDLRIGGGYRLANRFPDGNVVWIAGTFELIEPPHKLVYTWHLESTPHAQERVTVRFEPAADATEVIVTHEHIPDAATRDQHEQGWLGCLDGLAEYVNGA